VWSPGYNGALYDVRGQAGGYATGVPQTGPIGVPVSPAVGPVSPGLPAKPVNSPSADHWWSDATADPWRDPYAPSAVVVNAPAPAPVEALDLDPPPRHVTLPRVLLISVLSALLAGGLGGALGYLTAVRSGASTGTASSTIGGGANSLTQRAPQSFAAVAKAVLPSVVTIRVDSSAGSAIGTGFIVSGDGYVITNDHVTDGIDKNATVIFNDASVVTATLVGRDQESDIAVLKLPRTGLPAVTFGDSDSIAVGDPVLAIGSPLDLPSTVTFGIISAVRRPLEIDDGSGVTRYYSAIQTDAAVNHGNSGGPLVDAAGHVIGVDAVIKSLGSNEQEAGNIGLAFAIPIDQAKRVASQLIAGAKVPKTVIGATVQTSYHNPNGGVLVGAVAANGPAAQAGLQSGDLVVTVDGTPLVDPGDLTAVVREYPPGSVVAVVYKRGSDSHTVQVKLVADAG
jgi:putative serine protease PepD